MNKGNYYGGGKKIMETNSRAAKGAQRRPDYIFCFNWAKDRVELRRRGERGENEENKTKGRMVVTHSGENLKSTVYVKRPP